MRVGTGQRHRTGNGLAGQHLRQNPHSFSGGLGFVVRRGAHPDESHPVDSRSRLEAADGAAGAVSQSDEPIEHADDTRAPGQRFQKAAQANPTPDETAGQSGGRTCPAASPVVG